jgi:hypothetical protein
MEMALMAFFRPKFPFKGACSGNEASDWLATAFTLEEQTKPNLIQEIVKVT